MKELGRAGGKARHKPNPERINEGLRDYLKREVPPERVWRALELAMEGQNESARVSASRVLMDALAEPQESGDGCPRCAVLRAELPKAAERFSRLIEDRIARVRMERLADPLSALEELAAELSAEAVQNHPDLIVGDVTAERAEAIFQHLGEVGLLRRCLPEEQELVGERAKLKQEREALDREREELEAQRAEFAST